MKLVLLLALLTVRECSSDVVGRTGQNVTLPCKYDFKYYGPLYVCWGRGQIPSRGCSQQIIYINGRTVTTRASSRYQLLGPLEEGDVSLTIMDVMETDSGQYGCRVEIPGWNNDAKHHINLIIETAEPTTSSTGLSPETTEQTTANQTAGQLTSTDTLLTSSSSSLKAEEEGSSMTVVLVLVLFGVVVVVTAGGLFIIAKRWRRLNKIPQQQQQQVFSSIQFSSTSSTLHLHHRGSAVDNIYQMDGGEEGGEYESCP